MGQDQDQGQDRDRLIVEWMRSNEAFKGLARHYGRGGRLPASDGHPLPVDEVAKPSKFAKAPKPD